MISLIWAMDEKNLIGRGNDLPWHIKEDLTYFKTITKHKIVLMGHQTYLSMKNYYRTKPFPFKKIYVANLADYIYPDAIIVKDVVSFLKETKDELFVLGGKMIYTLSLPFADYLYISYIKGEYEGDVYFPEFQLEYFRIIERIEHEKVTFCVYQRNR